MFKHLKVGDLATYMVEGRACQVKVTARTAHQVICYGWKFDAITGRQLDTTLQPGANDWGIPSPMPLGQLVKD